ncbi:MAG: pyruvate kinase, partial [Myxococcales bacterium]
MRKAKIICTMGPASREEPTLGKLIEAGMDCARLNFSHGTQDDHARAIASVRRAADNAGRPIAILLDLQGPKIRVGKIQGGKAMLEEGAEVTIVADRNVIGTAERFGCSYEGLADDVTPGDPILINDGAIMLEVVKAEKKEVRARVVHGGLVSDHKGINLPGTPVSIPALTEKDLSDLQFGLGQGVDYVAMSFVRSADDIRQIKRYAPTTPIIAKLEKPQAVDRIDEIAQIADGVMIARGDLGVEMPLERVPLIQKTGIERTNYHGKIAIVATQMLESMIVSPRPTRAEVSDVANAILDGADSVMLSAETATGAHPVAAVTTMAAIIEEVERSARYQALPEATLDRGESTFATAVAKAAAAAAGQLGIGTICVYTRTGET